MGASTYPMTMQGLSIELYISKPKLKKTASTQESYPFNTDSIHITTATKLRLKTEKLRHTDLKRLDKTGQNRENSRPLPMVRIEP